MSYEEKKILLRDLTTTPVLKVLDKYGSYPPSHRQIQQLSCNLDHLAYRQAASHRHDCCIHQPPIAATIETMATMPVNSAFPSPPKRHHHRPSRDPKLWSKNVANSSPSKNGY